MDRLLEKDQWLALGQEEWPLLAKQTQTQES